MASAILVINLARGSPAARSLFARPSITFSEKFLGRGKGFGKGGSCCRFDVILCQTDTVDCGSILNLFGGACSFCK